MPDSRFNPRRFFLKTAASTGLAALCGPQFAQAFSFSGSKFEWLPTECADKRYPMQLIKGDLIANDKFVAEVPVGKIVNNGWGEIGSTRLIGPAQKAVPESLELAWFSFAENQFFEGTVPLPQAKLKQLFADGFKEPLTGEHVTWRRLIVGMGLGGWTSVWLAGEGIVREITRAQLAPAQLDWRAVLDNPGIERADYVRSKLLSRLGQTGLDTLTKHGPPVAIWPRYAQRSPWRLAAAGKATPQYAYLRYFNGERAFYNLTQPTSETLVAAPKHAQITWLSPRGTKLLTEIWLNETEIFGALDTAKGNGSDTSPLTLRVEYNAGSKVAVWIEGRSTRMQLTQSRVDASSLGK